MARFCGNCGAPLEPNARVCGQCGTPIARFCRACGAELANNARICSQCGTPVDPLSEIPSVGKQKRIQLTLLICGLIAVVIAAVLVLNVVSWLIGL